MIELRFTFQTVEEMEAMLAGNRIARALRFGEPQAPAPEPKPKSNVRTLRRGRTPSARKRSKITYLRHPDGTVLETLDPRIVDDWLAQGAQTITRAEFDRAHRPEAYQAEPAADPEPEPPAPAPTFEDVREAVKRVSSEKSMDALLDLLAEFGADRVSELKENDYPAFLARAEAILSG